MAKGEGLLGLPGLVGQLIDDARALVRAEVGLVKARALDLVQRSRTPIVLIVVALLAVQGAVVALVIGLVLELLPIVGPALAGLIVMVAMLLLAGILAFVALRLFSAKPRVNPAALETVA